MPAVELRLIEGCTSDARQQLNDLAEAHGE